MTVQRAIYRGKNIISNDVVDYLEDAELNDSIFLDEDEIEDVSYLEECKSVLLPKGLALVISKAKQTKNGSYRTFIGSADYQRKTTALKRAS